MDEKSVDRFSYMRGYRTGFLEGQRAGMDAAVKALQLSTMPTPVVAPKDAVIINDSPEVSQEKVKNEFCNECGWLFPKEMGQTENKEPHMCLKYRKTLKHFAAHPDIYRLRECVEADKPEQEGTEG